MADCAPHFGAEFFLVQFLEDIAFFLKLFLTVAQELELFEVAWSGGDGGPGLRQETLRALNRSPARMRLYRGRLWVHGWRIAVCV